MHPFLSDIASCNGTTKAMQSNSHHSCKILAGKFARQAGRGEMVLGVDRPRMQSRVKGSPPTLTMCYALMSQFSSWKGKSIQRHVLTEASQGMREVRFDERYPAGGTKYGRPAAPWRGTANGERPAGGAE